MRHFLYYKKTNTIHAFINIFSQEFYIIGGKELKKRINGKFLDISKYEVLFLRFFNQLYLNKIKDVNLSLNIIKIFSKLLILK